MGNREMLDVISATCDNELIINFLALESLALSRNDDSAFQGDESGFREMNGGCITRRRSRSPSHLFRDTGT